jgi:hypothetical protein
MRAPPSVSCNEVAQEGITTGGRPTLQISNDRPQVDSDSALVACRFWQESQVSALRFAEKVVEAAVLEPA